MTSRGFLLQPGGTAARLGLLAAAHRDARNPAVRDSAGGVRLLRHLGHALEHGRARPRQAVAEPESERRDHAGAESDGLGPARNLLPRRRSQRFRRLRQRLRGGRVRRIRRFRERRFGRFRLSGFRGEQYGRGLDGERAPSARRPGRKHAGPDPGAGPQFTRPPDTVQYPAGTFPTFKITAADGGSANCTLDVSGKGMVVSVMPLGTTKPIWTSVVCSRAADLQRARPRRLGDLPGGLEALGDAGQHLPGLRAADGAAGDVHGERGGRRDHLEPGAVHPELRLILS